MNASEWTWGFSLCCLTIPILWEHLQDRLPEPIPTSFSILRGPSLKYTRLILTTGFPGGSDGKEPAYIAGDPGSILGREDPLEKEMATHSSTLAWKIPWTEEPGRLQSMGLQRVGHD